MTKNHHPIPWLRRASQAGLASLVAIVGLVAFGTSAYAHNDIITATGSCASPLGTGYVVTWTIANDYNETESGTVTSVTDGGTSLNLNTLSSDTYKIAATPGSTDSTTTVTQTLPAGTALGTLTMNINSTWEPDGYTKTDSGTFALSSLSCSAPVQTISGHIYLCNNSNPTTTEEDGGTLAATGPSTVASTANPLSPTDVKSGSYTMTATPPSGYTLVVCGGKSTPSGGGTSATESVNVPSGGAGVGVFYVTLITQTIAGHIYLCNSGTASTTEVSGGTLAATGPSTVGSTANPLAPTNVKSGSYTMTATAPSGYVLVACGGSSTPNGTGSSATDSVSVPSGGAGVGLFYVVKDAPAINLVKSASITGYSAAGTHVTYTYVVTNTGNVTLNPVTVTDPMPGLSAISCPDTSLAPTASETCTATYTTTQANVNAGSINNTGTAKGTPPTGPNVTSQSSVSIPGTQTPGISLVKSASISGYSAAGTPVTYTYAVTNTGNVTLNPVVVTDPMAGLSAISCPDTSLAPAGTESCTATYTTTQADVNAGSINNTGTAKGTPPSGPNVTSQSSVSIPGSQTPSINLVKSASITSYSAPGTPVTYTYAVTNTGNVTLNPVTVTDPMAGLSAISCPDTSLAPAGSESCTATYTTTQADVNAGSINNTGTAKGTPPSGPNVTSQSSVSIPGSQTPSINLVKSASITSYSAPGTPVTYTYAVTNTGNVTLNPVTVTDPMAGLSAISCPDTSLAPAGSESCTATYTTTQADVNAGSINNTGTAKGTPPSGPNVTSQSSVSIPGTQTPGINLVKSASITGYDAAGTAVTYTYAVTNTGNVTLNPVVVTDPMAGLSALSCPDTSLAPAGTESCTATYTTTQADVDAGSINNTGTAKGTPPSGPNVTSQSSVSIPGTQDPSIGLVKSASITSFNDAGTPVTYSYAVTNTGNLTLNPVTVTDPMSGLSGISCPDTSLAPQATEVCTATYTTTLTDINNGSISNTGTATGTPPSGPVVSSQSSVSIPAIPTPVVTTQATASPVIVGGTLSDTVTVTGTPGNGLPTGTVDFYVCGPTVAVALCTSTTDPMGTATVPAGSDTGDVSTGSSGTFSPSAPGFYCFAAVFTPVEGGSYTSATDNQTGTVADDECTYVVVSGPDNGVASTTTTHVSAATLILGTGASVTDTATVTGLSGSGLPTGTVAFYVCGPSTADALCTSTTTPEGTATVPGGTDTGFVSTGSSNAFTPTEPGVYCFAAVFTPTADTTYAASTDNQTGTIDTNECVSVTDASTSPAGGTSTTPAATSTSALAFTGAALSAEVEGAAGLFLAGIALLMVSRRRARKIARNS